MTRRTVCLIVCMGCIVCLGGLAQGAGFYVLNNNGGAAFLGQINRVNVDGGGREQVADVDPSPFSNIADRRGFATDGKYFYYLNTTNASTIHGQIERTDLSGGNRTVVVPSSASPYSNVQVWKGLATDGKHLYILNTGGGNPYGGYIDRFNMDGTGKTRAADVAPTPFGSISAWKGFATDGKHFYYLNTNGGVAEIGQIDQTKMNGGARTATGLDLDPTPFSSMTSWQGFAMAPAYKPAALYRLDEPPSVAAVRDSAGGNDGTLIHPARVTKGAQSGANLGWAYDLQPGGGQGGGINLGSSHVVQPTDDFTITFRFQADTLNAFDRFVEAMSGTGTNSKGLRIDLGAAPGDQVRALLRDGTGASNMLHAGPTLETGEWYFASVRFDKDDELQVTVIPDSDPLGGTVVPANTGSQASALAGGVTYSASQQTLLGVEAVGGPAGNAFDGRMDDVAFYGSVLGDDQVKFVRRFGAQNSLPDEAWDGADPGASPAARWESNLGAGVSWNLSGGADEPLHVGAATGTKLVEAFQFVGGSGRAAASAFLPGRDMNLTAELWVKPTDLAGQEILLEAGGDAGGFSLLLNDNQLRFRMDQDGRPGWTDPEHLEASTTVPPELLGDFFQVVGTIDLVGNAIELFLNGELVATASTAGDITSWAGGNPDTLGSSNGLGGNIGGADSSDLDAFGTFEGLIGAVRMHHRLLTGAEIRASYQANQPIPEPVTLALFGLAAAGVGGYVRKRRRA